MLSSTVAWYLLLGLVYGMYEVFVGLKSNDTKENSDGFYATVLLMSLFVWPPFFIITVLTYIVSKIRPHI